MALGGHSDLDDELFSNGTIGAILSIMGSKIFARKNPQRKVSSNDGPLMKKYHKADALPLY